MPILKEAKAEYAKAAIAVWTIPTAIARFACTVEILNCRNQISE